MPRLPATEGLHPHSTGLEALSTRALLVRLHGGDEEAVRAVARALPALARVADAAASAIGAGGRLVYVGAGTSGRLAALDAAECPPTFGTARRQVVALVAGGARALARAVEGAEDDRAAALAAVRRARVGPRDLVVGVSASGRTPFVRAALEGARERGARTALLTSDAASARAAELAVVLRTGPELVAGSTRMKAGSAAKMALTLLSTAAMIRLGRARGGRMTALVATNEKLRERAVRIVCEAAHVTPARARALLARVGWSVEAALAARDDRDAPGGERRPSRTRRR